MKKKEERHLNILSEEWRKQKETLESKLACSVEQCKMLAASLNSATEDLKTRRLKSLENETRLMKVSEELQWRYEIKVQELKDSLHVMQADLTAKVKFVKYTLQVFMFFKFFPTSYFCHVWFLFY